MREGASEIAEKAAFDRIRYAQLWEDADVLTAALATKPGSTLVSICSAGDNALAMLTLDPKKVVVVDLSQAQIECLTLRVHAYRTLAQPEFLELMGARASTRRQDLLRRVLHGAEQSTRDFWLQRLDDVVQYGAGGVGKFENYFRLFRTWILPLAHSKSTVSAIFLPKDQRARQEFYDRHWNTWRWRLVLSFFFSRFMMGRLGRDKAFFDHVGGSVAAHVARRIRHAAIDCDPAENPYLHWIMTGTHAEALPMAWRAEHYDAIADRLDRLDIRLGSLESFVESGEKADGFNLSDIFEYMAPDGYPVVYQSILNASNPAARLVYWNMMAPRRVPEDLVDKVRRLQDVEDRQKAVDKAFFYSDFVVEEVRS